MTLIRISAKQDGNRTIKAFTDVGKARDCFDELKAQCGAGSKRCSYEVSVNTYNGERTERMAWRNGNALELISLVDIKEIMDAALTK